jgi:hypothetical protein
LNFTPNLDVEKENLNELIKVPEALIESSHACRELFVGTSIETKII